MMKERVFRLMLVSIVPTILIYLVLGELVTKAELGGQIAGYTINFAGPIAFYLLLVVVFKGWATQEASRASPLEEVDQEEIDQMSEDEKTRRLYEITAEIEILSRRRALLQPAAVPTTSPDMLITPLQVDTADIQLS